MDAQKLDVFALKTYKLIIIWFLVLDKISKILFFLETFLFTDTKMEVVLGIFFLALKIDDIIFEIKSLIWKSYSLTDVWPITKHIQLINKHKFAHAALDKDYEIFFVHVADWKILESAITTHLFQALLLASLQQNTSWTKIRIKYTDFAHVFSGDLKMELCENRKINKYAIELTDGKQLTHGPIYS